WLFQEEENPLGSVVQTYKSGLWGIDLGITESARRGQKENPSSKIYQLSGSDPKKIALLTVAKAAEAGDRFAIGILKEAGERLGRKAAFLVNLFNPEILVVGGGV